MSHFPAGRTLRIGTRSSPMALAQTEQVLAMLRKQEPAIRTEVVPVTTEADLWQGDLSETGGKGLFVKRIDRMVQGGRVDLAVHCLKDLPGDTPLPDGLVLAAVPPRDDVRDVLVLPRGSALRTLGELPAGATVGTSSVRRKAQLRRARPDLRLVAVRGAVGTRLGKLDGGRPAGTPLDALVVAISGLERIRLSHRAGQVFTVDEMLPAVGAGALALECRSDDGPVAALLGRVNDPRTMAEITAERSLLSGLRGHCNSPVAGLCVTGQDGQLSLRSLVFSEDGSTFAEARLRGDSADSRGGGPAELGARVCAELLRQGAREIIAGIQH